VAQLTGLRVAILATDGFEQSELIELERRSTRPVREPKSCRPRQARCGMEPQRVGSRSERGPESGGRRAGGIRRSAVAGGVMNPTLCAWIQGGRIREIFFHPRQACGGHLPRSMDRRGERAAKGAE